MHFLKSSAHFALNTATGSAAAFILLVGCSAVVIGCGDDAEAVADSTASTIGNEGGTVELPDGTALEIPSGALDTDLDISVEQVADLEDAGYEAVSDFVDEVVASVVLTPHGTSFEEPVVLRIPFEGDTSELVLLRADDESDESWEPVGPVAFGDGVASVEINQFSAYTLARVRAGACPCYTGADLEKIANEGTVVRQGSGYHDRSYSLVRTLPGPDLSDPFIQQWCDDRPTSAMCAPEGTKSYSVQLLATGLTGDQSDLTARITSNGAIRPDGTPVDGGSQCLTSVAGPPLPSQADHERYFPNSARDGFQAALVIPTLQEPINLSASAEILACDALVSRILDGGSAVQIGFVAAGLPTGESLVVELDGAPVVMAAADQLVFGIAEEAVGGSYEVTIETQPPSATCAVTAGSLTATVAEGLLIQFTCSAGPTVPASVQAACGAIDGLQCPNVDEAECIESLTEERDADSGACASTFDAVLECVADEIDGSPASAGCSTREPGGWEMAFPSPCQSELDAWEACQAPSSVQDGCTAGATLNCASFDETGCLTELAEAREMRSGDCATEFDDWLSCAAADPSNALVCISDKPYFEAVSGGGPCSTELQAWGTCIDP